MRDLAWIIKANIEAAARECAHAQQDGDWQRARQIDHYGNPARREPRRADINRIFDVAYRAARREG